MSKESGSKSVPWNPEGHHALDKKPEPTERYLFVKEQHSNVLEYGNSLARWIMASLILLNGGALIAMAGLLEKYPRAAAGGSDFVQGAVYAVATGIFAWFNCNIIADATTDRLDFVTYDVKDSKIADVKDHIARVLAVLAIISAFGSLWYFIDGAHAVSNAIQADAKASAQPGPNAGAMRTP